MVMDDCVYDQILFFFGGGGGGDGSKSERCLKLGGGSLRNLSKKKLKIGDGQRQNLFIGGKDIEGVTTLPPPLQILIVHWQLTHPTLWTPE